MTSVQTEICTHQLGTSPFLSWHKIRIWLAQSSVTIQDGSIPDDNPIPGSPIYAFGLRNVFGFAFQPDTGSLWNGPGGFDEVNKIEPGENYGWPLHMGVSQVEGFTDPVGLWYLNWPYRRRL